MEFQESAIQFAMRFARFVDSSPTPYHVCREVSHLLTSQGFVRLKESEAWKPVSSLNRKEKRFINLSHIARSPWREIFLHEKFFDFGCLCSGRKISSWKFV